MALGMFENIIVTISKSTITDAMRSELTVLS